MNENHVPHQIDINHNNVSWSRNGLCCFSVESHAYEVAKKIQWDTKIIFIFSIKPKSVIGKKKRKRCGISKNIMPIHVRTLFRGGGILFSKMPYLLVEEKFSLKRHLTNTNTPKKYLPMLYGYLFVTINYFS
jgi:hypothetical protein